jgi:hypothetical protein
VEELYLVQFAHYISMALENNGEWGSLQKLNKYLWVVSWE